MIQDSINGENCNSFSKDSIVLALQHAAKRCDCKGKLVVASYGQNPKTGENLKPKVYNFPITENGEAILNIVNELSKEPHRNIYMPLCIFKPGLQAGKKGGEADILAVLGYVVDFDDDQAHRWNERLPIKPTYVLETSKGRFQAGYLFKEGIPPDEAKKVAILLQQFSRCDFGTKDLSHVWRIAGTKNWPNKKKVDSGRSPEPQLVTFVKPIGENVKFQDLKNILEQWHSQQRKERQNSQQSSQNNTKEKEPFQWDGDISHLPVKPGTKDLILSGAQTGKRSEAIQTVLNALVYSNLNDSEIFSVFNSYAIGEKYRGQANPDKWLQPQIAKARAYVSDRATKGLTLPQKEKKAQPLPIPLPDELAPVMPFDYELLPDRLRSWVKDIAERMQCPPDFVAASTMAAMAAVIGRKIGIRPQAKTDWTVICNLWALVVGRPGVLKSPSQEAGLSPLKKLIASANERYDQDLEIHKTDAIAAKLRKEAAEKKARQVLQKDPNADLLTVLTVGEEPISPVLKRYQANDSTPASLGELLRQNPNGLLVFRDEVVSLLKSLDREGQEEGRGFYLTAWNGDSPYTFDRIGRGLNLHIPALCLSLLGGTQPGRLSEYIQQAVKGGSADDGLIQRFGLLIWPDLNGTWKNVDRRPDITAKNKAFKVFDDLDRLDPAEIGAEQDTDFEGKPDGIPYLRFDPPALELFTEWRTALEVKLRSDLHPALESHFAKYRKLIPSLALILHLADGEKGPVSETATLRALAWGDYLETHAERAYSSVSNADASTAKAILRRIKKGDLKPPFSTRDVWRPGWSKLSDRDQVMGGLRMLEDYRHICIERVNTNGRPKMLYHLNEVA